MQFQSAVHYLKTFAPRTHRGLVGIGVVLALAACAPGTTRLPQLSEDLVTGGQTADGRAHTAISDDGELQTLKESIDSDSAANRELANSILDASLVGLDNRERAIDPAVGQSQIVKAVRISIRIKIPQAEGSTQTSRILEFKADLAPSNSGGTNLRNVSTGGSAGVSGGDLSNASVENVAPFETEQPYRLSVVCRDRLCATAILRLRKIDTTPVVGSTLTAASTAAPAARTLAQAGLIHRRRVASFETMSAITSASATSSAALEHIARTLPSLTNAALSTIEVAWGTARFKLQAPTARLCPSGLLVETGTTDQAIESSCESGAASSLDVALIGNDNRGNLVLRLSEGSTWMLVRVSTRPIDQPLPAPIEEAEPPQPSTPTPAPDAPRPPAPDAPRPPAPDAPRPPSTPDGLIAYDPQHPITRAWERDLSRPEIRSRIDEWKRSSRLVNFLKRLRPNLPVMSAAFRTQNVPLEMLFITLIESNYFVRDGFPVEVSGVGAVGPWQFMSPTAAWNRIGLRVRPLNGRQAHPCDERGDLKRSTEGAAKYFKMLFDMFPSDPKLALVAYNWGPNRVDTAMDCVRSESCMRDRLVRRNEHARLNEIRSAGLDYWTVKRFNMAPRESIEYVLNFMGSQFVGRDPGRYGIQLGNDTYPVAPRMPDSCSQ